MPNLGVAIVRQYERGVMFRLGKVRNVREPGMRFMIPLVDRMRKVSLRTVTMPIQSQQVITKDNVSIGVAAVAYYCRVDAVKCIVEIENVEAAINKQFARLAKAVAHPKRIEILEILAQGEWSVDRLATVTAMGMTNTSAQLQVLRQARLVESRKEGPRVLYRLADDQVAGFVAGLRDLARGRLAEVDRVVRDYFEAPAALGDR